MRKTDRSWLHYHSSVSFINPLIHAMEEKKWTMRQSNGGLSDLGVRESIPSEAIPEMVKRIESS